MKKYGNYTYCIERFDGLNALCDALNNREKCNGAGNSSNDGSYDFTRTESYKEADHLAKVGDKENAEKVNQQIRTMKREGYQQQQRAVTKVRRSVVGSRPCVAAAIMGHPMSMYRTHKVNQPKKVVNVFYSVTASCGVSTQSMIEVGTKVTEAIRAIERSGVRVNLYVGDVSQKNKERAGFFVKIKDSSKDMDVTRMAYALIHPSFLRRHGFRWTETCKEINAPEWACGYGRTLEGHSQWREVVAYMNSVGWNVGAMIDFYSEKYSTVEQIVEHIMHPAK